MALQKLVPTGGLAAQRSGIQSAAVADVVDGRIAQLESEIVQGTHDALAAPGWIFLEQFDHEFLQRRIDGWSTDGVGPGKGPLLGDQDTEPPEQGIGSDKGGPLPQAASADELGFARQPDALGVGEAVGFATELFQENAILFLKVFDDRLLVSTHPAGDRDQEELELRRHRVENLSKVLVAQYSIGSRLNFLAVHGSSSRRQRSGAIGVESSQSGESLKNPYGSILHVISAEFFGSTGSASGRLGVKICRGLGRNPGINMAIPLNAAFPFSFVDSFDYWLNR